VAGNEATTTQNVTVDTDVTAPTITIAGDTDDNGTYNAAELATGAAGTVTATIAIPSDAVANDFISINGDTARAITAEEIEAGGITVEVAPEATVTAQITDQAGNTSDSASATAFATFDEAQVQITGVAITSSFNEVSIYSGAYLSVGASGDLNGGILTSGYTSIGADGRLGGNISSGGYTSTGDSAIVNGSVLSGDYVTAGASSTIDGTTVAVAGITEGAGATAGTQQHAHALDPSLMVLEQADAKQRVADAQDTLKAMEGEVLEASLGTQTLNAGVYEALNLATVAGSTLTLDGQGKANQTWIFNVTSILALGANTTIELINAGEGASVIWNVHSGYGSIGAGAEILGTIYALNYISVGADSSITGPNGTNGGLFTQSNYMTFGAGVSVGIAGDPTSGVNTNEVTGTAEAGSEVTISSGEGSFLGTTNADENGNFTYQLSALNVITLAAEDNIITASIDVGGETVTSDGFEYNDQLIGTYGNDTLDGTIGDDTIEGGIGDDILNGGYGDDYLIGGDGADTFIWNYSDTGVDHIKDFSISEGDKLDLSDILQVTEGDVLDDYLNFSFDGTNTTIDVFVGGDASTSDTASQRIILDGVDLVGSSGDAVIINNLFKGNDEGALIISDISTIDNDTKVVDIPEDSL
jgi:hypothetical protein